MKIVHWAMIFIVLVLPFSIICRDTIQKKNLVLQDQTRIDNVLDAATYDGAAAMLEELADSLGYGKNIPITQNAAMAAIDRFFQTMAVNFNLPSNIKVSKEYFGQYIPAILIVGYDGLYVYSYDSTNSGYQYVLKPKIPYAYTDETTGCMINCTLGNDVKLYFSNGMYFSGTLGEISEKEKSDLNEILDTLGSTENKRNYIKERLPEVSNNASLILYAIQNNFNGTIKIPDYLLADDVTQDYEYDENSDVKVQASDFHKKRRDVIINLITSVLREEINEHNTYADLIGVTYNFNIPDIDKDQWNNTINDISVLAFFQGMPIGYNSYYNNYSLGGARIVEAHYIYATGTKGITPDSELLYHKHNCPKILDGNGEIDDNKYDRIFINAQDAIAEGYHACEECR